ncbi:2-oxo acid dehydrogenase subunit E2 [Liquorilactobacillus satsumensis]|uniref:2-oxo acid dehydrogenase subunit E2 n=1 Tax=Liquorilactobacillus satsumensis TaxID=259059 RepID=UPI001E609698|nr:2-oxo acid dehydrogenase subunit E2 [Liquorilactobacillus satsumensis]MCC7666068.1 dienelactone hydrolase [Liquorilactobacillus satsumensis]MCP9356825.1 2-oxo acid dehydrogenase subunit E2 [Liquorilactobacillus satsumensis]MCP9370765.1 2-oxo acid dehydrogenase subunit E2 [Liquorilactobacillus satsumensis]
MGKYQFKLPDIGEGISEGTVAQWYVKPGDELKEDDDLLEIENDKSVEEIPSPVAGKVKQILVNEGETAEVGQVLVEFEVAGAGNAEESAVPAATEKTEETPKEREKAPVESEENVQDPAHPAALADQKRAVQKDETTKTSVPATPDRSLPVLAMPAVRVYAREQGVDLAQVKGTGSHGHVTKADVEAFIKGGGQAAQAEQTEEKAGEQTQTQPATATAQWPETSEKMSGIRKATAKAMVRSKSEIPHVTVFDDVIVDKLWDHRKKYKTLAAEREIKLTFLAYVVKALACVMREFPVLNSKVDMEQHEIVYRNYINVGVATDTERGLFVPNIKHADQKSLFAIARLISENTQKAKDGKLSGADMQHTGMSITNIGSIGGGFFTPVINWPEVAILGLGRITQEAVVEDGQVKSARVLKLSLSFDHRVIDGATAQRALNRLNELLSDPELLLMEG